VLEEFRTHFYNYRIGIAMNQIDIKTNVVHFFSKLVRFDLS